LSAETRFRGAAVARITMIRRRLVTCRAASLVVARLPAGNFSSGLTGRARLERCPADQRQHTTGGRIIPVPRIFITGSTDGLGRAAAGALISEGHDVVLHARTRERAAALSDLSSAAETRELAGQVNQIGRMDAVIHNAGVFLEPSRAATAEGHAKTLAVNTLAPYMLTALIGRPDRLIYLSSGLHHAGTGSLRDIDWTSRSWNAAQAYSESKLHVTALALTLARLWPEVLSNAVDPGWVPTKMGGPAATGDLQMGYLTQTWLAVSNDATATVSGGYWYHRQRQAPAAQARDPAFQDQLMDRLAALTGVALF